jgi:hypothetical protein
LDGSGEDRSPKPSERSQRALDWLNFFIADVETGFGPFIVVYLAANGWLQGQIGLVLTVGSVCGIAASCPAGRSWTACGPSGQSSPSPSSWWPRAR